MMARSVSATVFDRSGVRRPNSVKYWCYRERGEGGWGRGAVFPHPQLGEDYRLIFLICVSLMASGRFSVCF